VLARFCKISPDPEIVDGSGVIVAAFPEAVQSKVVLVSVPETEEESATWALVPEHMVRGEGTAGTTLGMGLTVTLNSVGEVEVQPLEFVKFAEIVFVPDVVHLTSTKSSEVPPPLTNTAPG